MAKVVIYTKSYCPFCKCVKKLFTSKGVEFEEIDIQEHPERRDEMIEKSNGRTTVPEVFINDKHIGGCDDTLALDEKGELDALLAE